MFKRDEKEVNEILDSIQEERDELIICDADDSIPVGVMAIERPPVKEDDSFISLLIQGAIIR